MPEDLFFYYLRTPPAGRWSPCLSVNHPDSIASTRNRKGHPPQHTPPLGQSEVRPLAEADRQFSLGDLRSIYPPPAPAELAIPLHPDLRKPRPGEVIGGGFTVFRIGRRSRRIRPTEFPFEHGTGFSAETEAQRLASQNPGQTFEVWSLMTRFTARVTTSPDPAATPAPATATTGA